MPKAAPKVIPAQKEKPKEEKPIEKIEEEPEIEEKEPEIVILKAEPLKLLSPVAEMPVVAEVDIIRNKKTKLWE